MRHLLLTSTNFKYLEQGFKDWLDTLGYSSRTVNQSPIQIREFFHYLENKTCAERSRSKAITHLTRISSRHIHQFLHYLQSRPALIKQNRFAGGGLSASSINTYITSLNLFARYVNQTGKHILDINPRRIENNTIERIILTQQEVRQLYESTFEPHPTFNSMAMGQRDRVILAIFYGCGLRKSEGSNLDLKDIDLTKRLVFVKKGKGNKQRYVPIAAKHSEDIRTYIEEGRTWFLQDNKSSTTVKQGIWKQDTDKEALFLNGKGKRMQCFDSRFKYIKEKSGIETRFSTHSLRHSIATHLLQNKMPIEEIARFLGHSSLESTQIYTHIVNTITDE